MAGLHVLDDHELLFSMVPIGGHYARSIAVRNPSQQPIIMQLILESGEIMENCKDHHGHIQPSSSSSFVHDDSTKQTKHGFSIVDSTVTEAYLHPYETASLGPIFFHPSSRCEWKSLALIRNNLSGVEWLPLHGIGGLLSLVLLEGSEPVHGLEFNLNLRPPQNFSSPNIGSDIQDATSSCYTPLSKKLFAFNVGDFPVKVTSIHVSGTKCELDGFIVLNCKSFSLEPGESVELEISYQTDFSAPLVQRDLELKLAAGVLVIPMKASLPLHMLSFCRKSILWVRVKKCCVFIVLAAILISVVWFLMPQRTPSCSVNSVIEGKKSSIRLVKPKYKSSTLHRDEGNGKSLSAAEHGGLKRVIIAEDTDTLTKGETETAFPSDSVEQISFPSTMPLEPELEKNAGETEVVGAVSLSVRTWKDRRRRQRKRKGAGSGLMSHIEVSSSQSGNSTPSSPLSPITNSFTPKDTCSPSPWKRESPGSSSPFICDSGDSYDNGEEAEPDLKANGSGRAAVFPARDAGNQSDNQFSSGLQPHGAGKAGSRPMLLPSATFPAMGRSASVSPPFPSTPSRLAVSPHARAPGPKPKKATQGEEQAKRDDRVAYDIWGNHLSGLHLTSTGVTDQSAMASIAAIQGDSDSFFSRGPRQILFTNCRSRSVK